MKKTYIIPSTAIQQTYSLNAICVGSVHGNTNLQWGGQYNPDTSPGLGPM